MSTAGRREQPSPSPHTSLPDQETRTPKEPAMYDDLDFDARDDLDAEHALAAAHLRETVTGLPARPGVRR